VDVGGEVADCGIDAFVEGGAESEMAAETHAGGALLKSELVMLDAVRTGNLACRNIL
jgi:hypothetical protein